VFPGARLRAQPDTQQPWAGGGAMNRRDVSIATLCGLLAVITGLIFLAGCSGGGSNNTTPPGSPTVSLSATSLTFTSEPVGTPSTGQTITINNTGSASL